MAEFFVIFRASDNPRWWRRFLRQGFGHVYAVSQLHDDVVLGVNPTADMLEIGLMSGRAIDYARAAAQSLENRAAGVHVLRVQVESPRFTKHASIPVTLASCATTVAYHIGLPIRSLTPYGLYRALLTRFGAEVVRWDS